MIVADDPALKSRFTSFLGASCRAAVQYTNPLKALDNLKEIEPDAVICRAADYPRHWKLLVKELREFRSRDEAVFVLAVNDDFDSAEADKAVYLGVNFLYPDRLETKGDLLNLRKRIGGRIAVPHRSPIDSWVPEASEKLSFMFRHPGENRMISGRFTAISPAGGLFRPDDSGDIPELETGMEIPGGTMRIGESVISMGTRVIIDDEGIYLVFTDFADNGFQNLFHEIHRRGSAELDDRAGLL